jgi:hypothetical protein
MRSGAGIRSIVLPGWSSGPSEAAKYGEIKEALRKEENRAFADDEDVALSPNDL